MTKDLLLTILVYDIIAMKNNILVNTSILKYFKCIYYQYSIHLLNM